MEAREVDAESAAAEPEPREPRQPPLLFPRTQKVIRRLAERLDGPLVTYWVGGSGWMYDDDVVVLQEVLQGLPRQRCLYLFIKSAGGSGQVALRIVHLLRTFAERIVALVPCECASAATILALGTDEIRLGPLGYLSPVDTSILHDLSPVDHNRQRVRVSLDELKRVITLWKSEKLTDQEFNPYQALLEHVHPLVIGAADRADSLSVKLCQEVLRTHLADRDRSDRIARDLNANYPSHSFPITLREARRLGLDAAPLEEDLNEDLLQLHALYSEMAQEAITDFNPSHFHDNEIVKILESTGRQIHFQTDHDSLYRSAERRWVTINDNSGWRRCERVKGRTRKSKFHLR